MEQKHPPRSETGLNEAIDGMMSVCICAVALCCKDYSDQPVLHLGTCRVSYTVHMIHRHTTAKCVHTPSNSCSPAWLMTRYEFPHLSTMVYTLHLRVDTTNLNQQLLIQKLCLSQQLDKVNFRRHLSPLHIYSWFSQRVKAIAIGC